jgi:type IV pilus assembly protein PilM
MAKENETSVWKKEISFRRKPKEKPEPMAPVQEAKPADTSVWKKEISFRRKPKQEAGPVVPVVTPPTPAPLAPPPTPAPLAPPLTPEPLASPPPAAPTMAPAPQELAPAPVPPPLVPDPPVLPPEPEPPVGWPEPSPVTAHEVAFPPVTGNPEPELPSLPPVSSVVPVPSPVPTEAPQVSGPAPHEVEAVAPTRMETGYTPAVVPIPVSDYGPAAAVPEMAAEPAEATAAPAQEPVVEPVPAAKLSRRERKEQKSSAAQSTKEHNELVGLKLGASQIAAAHVLNKGGPKIVRMARQPLERGVVVGGELREPEALATELKAFFKKNKLPRNCVRLGISNNRIGVRTFEIAGIDDPKKLANAVRFRAQETLPIPLDEAVLDYRVLDDRVGEDGVRVCRVLLVVAHRELVERYVAACRKAGLKLVGIDLEAFALLRALSDPSQPPGEDAAVVCVSIGHDRSTLAVSDGRMCQFTRVLAWGGATLDAALARVLDMTPSAVVPIKHALDLGEEGAAAGLDARHADEARRAMVAEIQSFARELVASLRFYQEQPNSLGIVEILVTGGATASAGLAAELERLMGIPLRVADPFTRVKVARSVQDSPSADFGSMAVAVGLGIEDS